MNQLRIFCLVLLALLTGFRGWGQGTRVTIMVDDMEKWLNNVIQPKHEEKVDDTRMECIYEYSAADTVAAASALGMTILQVGKEWTKFQDYDDYWLDSLCWQWDWKLTERDYQHMRRPFVDGLEESQLRRMGVDWIECKGRVGLQYYSYEDSTARFRWKLSADTATVCGYPCRKATSWFRGRTWTAWYTEEIPVDAGPWKLHGLPGLILLAEDSEGLLRFEAVQLRAADERTYYVSRKFPEKGDQRPTRESVLELQYVVARHTEEYIRSQVKVNVVNSPTGRGLARTLFYQPLELE